MHPATRNEFKIKRNSGIFVNACAKLSSVGCFGIRFISIENNSPDGINAMESAYIRTVRIR